MWESRIEFTNTLDGATSRMCKECGARIGNERFE